MEPSQPKPDPAPVRIEGGRAIFFCAETSREYYVEGTAEHTYRVYIIAPDLMRFGAKYRAEPQGHNIGNGCYIRTSGIQA